MIPLLVQIAWVIVIVRCGYAAFKLLNRGRRKPWLDILFYISVVIIALAFLL
ncbi:hypothetical protein [Ammoniphilus sp. YIM 78166]|uniref:hypothetical protein n=1 Tax=Ammoniphilus sp. YIM 78166 TaxID=1644106 RepID=UPI001430CC28|nr:hypothetical protein [Ammoniphilus sp. YIM 78166]